LALLVVVAVAAACGGGPRNRADFVHDASRICRKANALFARVDVEPPTERRAQRALTEVVEIGGEALGDLRRVKPPKAAQSSVDAWLGLLEQALDEVKYATALLQAHDVTRAVSAIARADVLTARATRVATDVGIGHACRVPKLLPGQ
jgi:hypothetical protein